MTKLIYPKSVAAALSQENSQWRLGDALLEEVGEPSEQGVKDGSYMLLEEVASEIAMKGGDKEKFDSHYLGQLRQVSFCFPETWRRHVSWSIHFTAGNPDILDKIIELAGGEESVTRDGVRKYLASKRSRSHGSGNM